MSIILSVADKHTVGKLCVRFRTYRKVIQRTRNEMKCLYIVCLAGDHNRHYIGYYHGACHNCIIRMQRGRKYELSPVFRIETRLCMSEYMCFSVRGGTDLALHRHNLICLQEGILTTYVFARSAKTTIFSWLACREETRKMSFESVCALTCARRRRETHAVCCICYPRGRSRPTTAHLLTMLVRPLCLRSTFHTRWTR